MHEDPDYPLMPCPFCGQYAFYLHYQADWMWAVTCSDCSVRSSDTATKEQAAEIWNRRVKIYVEKSEGAISAFHPLNRQREEYEETERLKNAKPLDLSSFWKSKSDDGFLPNSVPKRTNKTRR